MAKMRLIVLVLAGLAGLAGCSPSQNPPSMSPEREVQPTAPIGSPLADVQAWMSSAAVDAALVCYLDAVEGAHAGDSGWHAGADDTIKIAGWAVDMGTGLQRAAAIRLHNLSLGGGDVHFPADRSERADVSAEAQFAATPPVLAGLGASLRLEGVAPGTYEIFYVVGDAAHAVSCTLGPTRLLTVG